MTLGFFVSIQTYFSYLTLGLKIKKKLSRLKILAETYFEICQVLNEYVFQVDFPMLLIHIDTFDIHISNLLIAY